MSRSTGWRLFGLFAPYRWQLLLSAVLVSIDATIPGALVFLIQKVLDDVLIAKDSQLLAVLPAAVVGLYVLKGGVTVSRGLLTRSISWRVVSDLREALYAHMLMLDLGWHQQRPTGERVSRLSSDVNNLQYASSSMVTAFQKPLTLLALVGSAFYMNPKLAAVSLCVLPLVAIPIDRFGRWMRASVKASMSSGARLAASAQESFAGIRVIQVFGAEAQRAQRFQVLNRQNHDDQRQTMTAQLLPSAVVELIAAMGMGAAIWLGGQDVFKGVLQPGELIGFIAALAMMNDPLKGLAQVGTLMSRALASAETLFELLDTPSSLPDQGQYIAAIPQVIRAEQLSFAYADGKEVLTKIQFSVRAGERIAIVGASGSGKTTLLSLLSRLRDPSGGGIFWDDVDLRACRLASVRAQIAVVTQEPFLFDDTVAANIRFGRPDATEAEVIAAAQAANAHDFILSLPLGYQSPIDELGMRLSGGQRQRLCIARAVLRGAPVLLLDEATSNLDAESEALVNEALDRLMRGRTTFVVAHRLSTIRDADRIFVMDQGQIVEEGTDIELRARGGVYARLLARQA